MVARTAEGELLGCGGISRHSYQVAELRRLYARPEFEGVEFAILSALEQKARLLGYRSLRLTLTRENHIEIAFYESNGFMITGESGYNIAPAALLCLEKSRYKDAAQAPSG